MVIRNPENPVLIIEAPTVSPKIRHRIDIFAAIGSNDDPSEQNRCWPSHF